MRERPSLTFQPGLEGLRAVAIIGVLLFHSNFEAVPGGFLGVSTFFTLSGFLITSLLVNEHRKRGQIDLASFYGRRVRRLLPASLLALACVSLLAPLLVSPEQLERVRGDVLWSLFYVANWRFVLDGQSYEAIFSLPSPVQHFWSLGIEEQYYLLFPPLAWALLRLGRGRRGPLALALATLTLASAAAMALLHQPGQAASRAYYGTDARAAELLIGALLAVALDGREARDAGLASPGRHWRDHVASGLGLVALLASMLLWTLANDGAVWLYRGGFAANAALAALIIAGAIRPGPLRALLSATLLRWIGRISYGLYVYHWPVFLLLDAEGTGLSSLPLFALRVGVSTLLATLSYLFIEAPIRSRRRLAGPRGWLALPLAIGAVAAATLCVTAIFAIPDDDLEGASKAGSSARGGEASGLPRILVVGDSVAGNLASGLQRWAREGARAVVEDGSLRGCGLARGGELRYSEEIRPDAGSICEAWAGRWPEQIRSFEPDLVLVASGVFDISSRKLPGWTGFRLPGDADFDAWLSSEYERAIDVLSSRGARLAWLTFPCADLSKAGRPKWGPVGAFEPEYTQHLNRVLLPELAARRADRVELVDLFGYACPDGHYVRRLGPIKRGRRDGLHFSRSGARWVADWLGPQLLEMLSPLPEPEQHQ